MTKWHDSGGREWTTVVDLATVDRIRREYEVDLLNGAHVIGLGGDIAMLVSVLYGIYQEQAEAAGISGGFRPGDTWLRGRRRRRAGQPGRHWWDSGGRRSRENRSCRTLCPTRSGWPRRAAW